MVKRLKKRFMLISVLSVFAALVVLISAMNIINYRKLIQESDEDLQAFYYEEMYIPAEYDDILVDDSVITGYSSTMIIGDVNEIRIPESSQSIMIVSGSNRTYYAEFDSELNMTVLRSTMFGYTTEEYKDYSIQAIKSGKKKGFVGDFRFSVMSYEDGSYRVDCCNVSESLHNFTFTFSLIN